MKVNFVYALQVLLALLLLVTGVAKLAGMEVMAAEFEIIGLGPGLRIVAGFIEISGALCLIVPRLALIGAVLAACVMLSVTGAMIARATSVATSSAPRAPHLTVSRGSAGCLDRSGRAARPDVDAPSHRRAIDL